MITKICMRLNTLLDVGCEYQRVPVRLHACPGKTWNIYPQNVQCVQNLTVPNIVPSTTGKDRLCDLILLTIEQDLSNCDAK